MRCFRLPSALRLFILMLSVFVVAGCIRKKPSEPEASSPTVPGVGNPAEDSKLEPGETFQVKFETSKGDFIVEAYSGWAPVGTARFKELVTSGFYDGCRFFRVIPGFMVQWGINGNPSVQKKWVDNMIPDEKVLQKNRRGTISFAKSSAPNSRTAQLFINYGDNTASLNPQGFSPFAKVIQGMDVVDAINAEYGEQPKQVRIQAQGNAYLNKEFPNLDYIIKATILPPAVDGKTETKASPQKTEASKTESSEPNKAEQPKTTEPEKKALKEEPKKETKPATSKTPATSKAPATKEKKKSPKPETIEEVK